MNKDGMRWNLLKTNKCPQCHKDLALYGTMTMNVLECKCGFRISETLFNEIVMDRVKKDLL